ncbi:hypothetical protein ACJRO7_011271 [Eucalyptus globulus]|uniref:Uncharacterized protein n=1 Tax=Eucalyptus globulus TaxID=34317 RepID=A0ABD3LEL5_EUCGL
MFQCSWETICGSQEPPKMKQSEAFATRSRPHQPAAEPRDGLFSRSRSGRPARERRRCSSMAVVGVLRPDLIGVGGGASGGAAGGGGGGVGGRGEGEEGTDHGKAGGGGGGAGPCRRAHR